MDHLRKTCVPVSADFEGEGKHCTHCVAVTFDDVYENVLTNALPILVEKRIPAAIFVPTGFLGDRPAWMKDQNPDRATERVMTEEQLRNLPADLFAIGSHSCSHKRLTGLTPEEIEEDLSSSKERLERVLGREVSLLAFPYDDWDERLIRISRKLGFKRVFANAAMNRNAETSGYLYSRTQVSLDDGDLEFRLKMRGAYWWLAYAIALKHRLENSMAARPRN
jgi:peptidoglycan/xylan/chitin deacetylase (PgdA/CDA1 family)